MMSGVVDGLRGEVVSFTVIFSRIKNMLLKQQDGPVNQKEPKYLENFLTHALIWSESFPKLKVWRSNVNTQI